MKKSGSPSSVSLGDSDEKPGSAGNNLHLRTSGPGFGRGLGDEQRSSHSGMQMSSQPMTGSQSLLNTMPHSPPHILQIPKRQQTMSMSGTGNHGQDHGIYHQQYLQVQSCSWHPFDYVYRRCSVPFLQWLGVVGYQIITLVKVFPRWLEKYRESCDTAHCQWKLLYHVNQVLMLNRSWYVDFISSVNHKDGCWMQGVNSGQTGPNLSLSSLGGGQLGLSHQPGGRGQPVSNQMFSGMDSAVPWLSRTNNLGRSDLRSDGLTQVVGRSGGMNLQHHMATDSKSGITSASANSPSSQVIYPVRAACPSPCVHLLQG